MGLFIIKFSVTVFAFHVFAASMDFWWRDYLRLGGQVITIWIYLLVILGVLLCTFGLLAKMVSKAAR
jgi:hypothetical protein